MALAKIGSGLILLLGCFLLVPCSGTAQSTTLYQTVEQALDYSPQLQALVYNRSAVEHDLKQTRARYGPSIDLLLGYGAGQHSDSATRLPGAHPSDSEWNSRGDATLRLTQKLYDFGETSQSVSIQEAILDSTTWGIRGASQAVALEAINAHLEVYRQRELVALAQKDLEVHQDIYRALSDIEQAGAGDIADVTQTQTRMARAQSILIISQGDLRTAMSNYERVVGVLPGELAFAEVPVSMPDSLEEAMTWTTERNPELLAFNAKIMEAEAKVGLARSAYMPKLNLEFSSRYHDQLEGDPSWQHTNDAMVVLRWNLFNGGQDIQATNAAVSRKYRSRSNRDDKLIQLREATTSAWAVYLSLQYQKTTYQEAVESSMRTFDAYLKQFSVSRRSLLDVLNAEKEYFQSARQLVIVSVDEIISAYRILNLGGELKSRQISTGEEISGELSRLSQDVVLPSIAQTALNEAHESGDTPGIPYEQESTATADDPSMRTDLTAGAVPQTEPMLSIEIGPCINDREIEQAKSVLHRLGVDVRQRQITKTVTLTRLLEGVYPPDEASQRLKTLRRQVEAFALPEEKKLAIYLGSYKKPELATHHAKVLAEKNIAVTPVAVEIEIPCSILVVHSVDRQTAETLAEQISAIGLETKIY